MRNDVIYGDLPDVFMFKNGERVKSVPEWEARRGEILRDTIALEYGGMPPAPEAFRLEPLDLHGKGGVSSYRAHCGTRQNPFSFCFMIYRPRAEGKYPAVITGDENYAGNMNEAVVAEANRRGYAAVKFDRTEFAGDIRRLSYTGGLYDAYPGARFSAVSAWAWGYHRAVDALMQIDDIDSAHIAITGHSRGGKAVLLAGATNGRIRYVHPCGSGAHGGGCYRFAQRETPGAYAQYESEPLGFMFDHVPYWLGDGMRAYVGREGELPHDMHFVKALIAPRCLLECNGYGDIWSNPRGAYLSHIAAREVWDLYGARKNCRTWYREGGHRQGMEEFEALFDFMRADIAGEALPEAPAPYTDMAPLHSWTYPKA